MTAPTALAPAPLAVEAPAPRALPPRRYVTLEAARALECNGCGDCCDSSRTEGFWTWGALPEGQYASIHDGAPLIIPLERVASGDAGGWRDRAWRPEDASQAAPTPFRCTAFLQQPDGRGLCGAHDRVRPPQCGEFPVHTPHLEADLAVRRVMHLETSAFPRCRWYRMDLVAADEPALDAVRGCLDTDGYVALAALPPSQLAAWGVEAAHRAPPRAAA